MGTERQELRSAMMQSLPVLEIPEPSSSPVRTNMGLNLGVCFQCPTGLTWPLPPASVTAAAVANLSGPQGWIP